MTLDLHSRSRQAVDSSLIVTEASKKSARIIGVVLDSIFAKNKRKIFGMIFQFTLDYRKQKLKTLYPKMRHLVKPVSPARGQETFNSAVSVVSSSLIMAKGMSGASQCLSKSPSIAHQSPALTKNYSKVSMFDWNSIKQDKNLCLSEREIIADRFVKHQALRSISRNRPPVNLEKMTSASSQFQIYNDPEVIQVVHPPSFKPEVNLVTQSANFTSPLLNKSTAHNSSKAIPPQTDLLKRTESLITPKMFYDSYSGNIQKSFTKGEKKPPLLLCAVW